MACCAYLGQRSEDKTRHDCRRWQRAKSTMHILQSSGLHSCTVSFRKASEPLASMCLHPSHLNFGFAFLHTARSINSLQSASSCPVALFASVENEVLYRLVGSQKVPTVAGKASLCSNRIFGHGAAKHWPSRHNSGFCTGPDRRFSSSTAAQTTASPFRT